MSHLKLAELHDLRKRSLQFDGNSPGFPQQGFFFNYDLMSDPETFEHEPALQVNFAGFQCLCADVEAVKFFDAISPGPHWGVLGFGAIVFSSRIINSKVKAEWDSEDSSWVKAFVASVCSDDFQLKEVAVSFGCQLNPENVQVAYFILTKLVTEEEWAAMYQAKSLELTASTKYFEHVKGVEVGESPLPPNVSFGRTLN